MHRWANKVSVDGEIDLQIIEYIKALERPLINSHESVKLYSTNDLVDSYNRARIEKQHGTIKDISPGAYSTKEIVA